MTLNELKNSKIYKYHHTAYIQRYVSRKQTAIIQPYKGRYGEGYTVLRPNWNSTQYSYIDYYVKEIWGTPRRYNKPRRVEKIQTEDGMIIYKVHS